MRLRRLPVKGPYRANLNPKLSCGYDRAMLLLILLLFSFIILSEGVDSMRKPLPFGLELRFGLEEVSRELLAYPDSNLDVVCWNGEAWVPYEGIFGDWMDSDSITEEEAMRITSGAMPE